MASKTTGLIWPPSVSSIVAVTLLAVFVYRSWKARVVRNKDEQFAKAKGCAPPPLWCSNFPLGLDLLVKAFWHGRNRTVCEFFVEISELSGPTHEQRLLGARNIGTTAPKNLEAVLTKQFDEFNLGFRIPQFRDLMGSSVFTQEGPAWRHSRDLLRPQFSSNRYHSFEDIRRCVEEMLGDIVPGRVVDLQPLCFGLTLDTTWFMLFGGSASESHSGADKARRAEFGEAFSHAQEYLAYRTRVGDFHWLINGPSMWRACKTVHNFVDSAVQEALTNADEGKSEAKQGSRHVFINALIEQTRDPKVLRDQSLSVMFAGRDSTASGLMWTFRLLARHPKVLATVRDEIASVVGLGSSAQQPGREELKQMKYLSLVIKEALRLYPPVPVNQRAATKTTTLPEGGGEDGKSPVVVHEGESVGYLIYAMHRRKDLYGDDAKSFRPERWQDDSLKDIGYGYLPFGAGPRVCLGQESALLLITYTVARMVQCFPYMTLPEGETMEIGQEKQVLTLVVYCAEGCRVQLNETC